MTTASGRGFPKIKTVRLWTAATCRRFESADVSAPSKCPAGFQAGFVPKLLPTTVPVTLPMMAPATNSDNQWMLTETLKPM